MMTRPGRGVAALVLASLCATAWAAGGPVASQAWARATAPGVDVGAVYLTIDGGAHGDRLVSASTPRAAMVHLHTVEESNGVARMRPVEGVDVPAAGRVVLAPKGTHIMLMGLVRPLVAGETFPLSLRFEKAGEQVLNVVVRAAGEDAPPPQPPH
jgi:periplasmic copper chaperone A